MTHPFIINIFTPLKGSQLYFFIHSAYDIFSQYKYLSVNIVLFSSRFVVEWEFFCTFFECYFFRLWNMHWTLIVSVSHSCSIVLRLLIDIEFGSRKENFSAIYFFPFGPLRSARDFSKIRKLSNRFRFVF